jgi:hypothetical protein
MGLFGGVLDSRWSSHRISSDMGLQARAWESSKPGWGLGLIYIVALRGLGRCCVCASDIWWRWHMCGFSVNLIEAPCCVTKALEEGSKVHNNTGQRIAAYRPGEADLSSPRLLLLLLLVSSCFTCTPPFNVPHLTYVSPSSPFSSQLLLIGNA